MNEVRRARTKLVGDRFIRSALGASWLVTLLYLVLDRLHARPLRPEWFAILGLCALLSYYADAMRPPVRRGLKEVSKASIGIVSRASFPLILFAFSTGGKWGEHLEGKNPSLAFFEICRTLLGMASVSMFVAVLLFPIGLPVLMLLDRWLVSQETEDRMVLL